MRAAILLLLLSASALANPGYTPAYSQSDAQQGAAQASASNMAFATCTICPATHAAHLAALQAQAQANCQKDYASAPQLLAKCSSFWSAYYGGQQ